MAAARYSDFKIWKLLLLEIGRNFTSSPKNPFAEAHQARAVRYYQLRQIGHLGASKLYLECHRKRRVCNYKNEADSR